VSAKARQGALIWVNAAHRQKRAWFAEPQASLKGRRNNVVCSIAQSCGALFAPQAAAGYAATRHGCTLPLDQGIAFLRWGR
jgi:hypothetical protein